MKRIAATRGHFAIVDDEDFDRLSQFRWYAHSSTGMLRPARRTGADEGRRVIFMHHEVAGRKRGLVIDHINGDPWDNRRANLRHCTDAENLRNQKGHRDRQSSPYKGVHGRGFGFEARIMADGKKHYLGCFKTAEEAARAYDAAAKSLHGEFARTNFPA